MREGRRGDRTWFLVLTPALGACRMTAAERTNGETAVRSAIWRRAAAGTGRQRLRGGRPPAQKGCPSNEHHGGLGKRVRMDVLATIGWFQLLFDEGGGVGGVDRHLHHVQLAGVPTCAAASTLTHTAAGVGEGRGQGGCRPVRPRQAPVRVLRVVHALPSRVVRPAARAFLSRSSPMIAAPRGADGRGARARCRHPAPWSPRGRRREKRQLSPRHRVPPPR